MKESNGRLNTDERARAIAKRLKEEDGYIVKRNLIKKIMSYAEDTIIEALMNGYDVRTSLGTYDLAYKPPLNDRTAMNLQSGEKISYSLPERNLPRLRFGSVLKDMIKEATEGDAYVFPKDAKKMQE